MDLAAAPLQRADQAPQQAPARRRYKRKPKPKNPAWAAFQTLRPNDRLLIDAAAKMIGVACSLVASKDGLSAKPHLIRYKSNLEQEGYLVAHAPTHTRGDGLGHLTTNGYSTFTAAKVQELFQTNGGYPDTSNSHWRRFSTQDLGIVDSPAPLMQETPASMFEQLPEPMFEQLPEPMLQQAPAPVFEHPLTPPLHHQNNPVDDANIANASATNRLNFNASPSDSTIYDYSAVDMEEWPSVTNAYSASYNDPYAAYANKAMGVPIPSGSPNASVPVSPESINPALLTLEPHQSQGIQAFGPGGPGPERQLLPPSASKRVASKGHVAGSRHVIKNGNRSHECLDSYSASDVTYSSSAARASLKQQVNKYLSNATSPNVPVPCHVPSPTYRVLPRLTTTRTRPRANGIELLKPEEKIPDKFLTVFPYSMFNAVQSKCFNSIYMTDDNMIVSAPTGSGKTVLLELAICKLASLKCNENAKIVYIAPTKALCREKAEQWRKKFAMMAMPVSELTGDTSYAAMRTVRDAKIIVTTPEKWDSITRGWVDHRKLLDLVELFLIDEVHILKESRGATLEAIVSRMKTYGSKVRFIALSATIPNSADVASWLGRSCENPSIPAHREVFGEEFRPVKLQKFVHCFDTKLTDHAFDSFLNSQLWKHIEMHTHKKPMLVFCMTRKSCLSAAEELAKQWSQRRPSERLWPQPSGRIPVIDASLRSLVRHGVAFHHAGLELEDRKAVHQAFEEGHLSVICCTSTLAIGVNLPCHTVVLKGTVSYQDGGQLCEYSDLEVMQMLGRAGRPQYEDSALAIILTRSCNKTRYEDLGSGRQVIESTLHKNLIEHLNSEISLGTFQDIKGARLWMKGTFLSFRLQKNPRFYSDLAGGTANLDAQNLGTFDDQLEQICETAITNLKEVCLVKGDATFQHTDYGRAMSKYMIRFETMKLILGIPRGAKVPDLLSALCDAHEFHGIRWQANEKELFRNINRDPFIVHPINGTVSAVAHKISLLIQMELGRVQVANINGFERQRLRAETSRVLDLMHRLIRTVIECKGSDTDGQACWAALELSRSMAARAWEDKAMQLLQVPQLGPALMRKLVSHNIRTVSQLADSDPGDIERIASRNPPFGQRMVDSVMSFPRLTIGMTVKDSKVNLDGSPVIHVDGLLGFTNVRGKWQGKMPIVTFLAVATEGTSSYFCRKSLKAFDQPRNTHQIHFTWTPKSFGEALICRFACEAIVGTFVSTELHHNLPASAFKRRIRSSQFPSAKGHGSVLPQLPTGCPPIETKIDEDNILGIQGNIRSEAESSELGELEAHTRDDEPLAMFDRNCTITSPLDSTLSLEVTQKRAAEPFTDQGHWQLGNPGPSSHAVQQKADIDIRKHLPRSRKSRSPGDLPQTSDGEATEGEPVRLANGRYRCGHPCSQVGGGTTVRGDKCGHDCCRNGSKHPPRKKNSSGKRKVHSGDEAKSSTESIPDLTLFEPSLKRARKNDASKSTARAGVSPAFSPTNQTQLLQRRTTLDLELCDVDEEGIIDLTCDYETASDAPRRAVAPSIDKNGAITSANKTPKTIENLLGDLSDDDFIDIDSASESTHMGRRTQISHKLSNSADYLKETTSSTLLNEVQYKGMHSARNKSPQMASEESNVSRERIVDVTERGKSGSRCSQMTDESMFELPAPLSKPMGEKASNDDGGPDKQFSIKRAKQRMARLRSSLMSGAASSGSASFAIPQDERPVQNELVATQTKEAIEPQWEPQWVNEFDPALICEFRGLVDFI